MEWYEWLALVWLAGSWVAFGFIVRRIERIKRNGR